MGDDVNMRLPSDLVLWAAGTVAGETTIPLLLLSNGRKLWQVTEGKGERHRSRTCPIFLVKLKQP